MPASQMTPSVRNVTIGQAVVAMIINGLGFTGQTLYLFPEFFEDKPIDRLLQPFVVTAPEVMEPSLEP